MQQSKIAFLIFNHMASLSCHTLAHLIQKLGSPEEILKTPYGTLTELLPDQIPLARKISEWEKIEGWEEDLKLVERLNVSLLTFLDGEYPSSFLKLASPPPLLYVQGELPLPLLKTVAIVGTRNCTIYGKEMAEKMAKEAGLSGYTVISGLARGIDTAAHVGALSTGKTIAIIGSGLASIYPKENESLAREIAKKGAVLSEFPMNASPQKHHFPKRNRLVSALCQGILLAEAPRKSGAMITMEMAEKEEKKCFAIPGRADSESFRGNHFLIKEGKAKLVENWQEMLSILEPGFLSERTNRDQRIFFTLSSDEQKVLACLSSEELFIEEIAKKSEMPIAKLNSLLIKLVLKQAIREFPGKYYKKSF
jgi:DNA processing protein